MLNTAIIRFDLPQGVYLTSDLGATFGVPEPATAWLVVTGLAGCCCGGAGARCPEESEK